MTAAALSSSMARVATTRAEVMAGGWRTAGRSWGVYQRGSPVGDVETRNAPHTRPTSEGVRVAMGRKLPMPACVRPCVCRARHVNGCSCTPPQAASRAGEVGKRRESAQSAICSWNLAGTYDFLRAYIATRNDAGGRAPPRAPQPRMPETDATHNTALHDTPRLAQREARAGACVVQSRAQQQRRQSKSCGTNGGQCS